MEELDFGLEALIDEIAMENDDADIPEYNRVNADDSIAVRNAKLAAQAKARAGSSGTPQSNAPAPTPNQNQNQNNSGSILWKNRQKAY